MKVGLLVLPVSLLVSRTTLGSSKWAGHCSELACNIPAAKLSGPKECPSKCSADSFADVRHYLEGLKWVRCTCSALHRPPRGVMAAGERPLEAVSTVRRVQNHHAALGSCLVTGLLCEQCVHTGKWKREPWEHPGFPEPGLQPLPCSWLPCFSLCSGLKHSDIPHPGHSQEIRSSGYRLRPGP